MRFPDATAEEAHRGTPYTADFVERPYPQCEGPPVFTDVTEMEPA